MAEDMENRLTNDELREARQWVADASLGADGFYIEYRLVAHLVAEVDRLHDEVAQLQDILAEQRRIIGERQPPLFPDDER